jgi:hypothetical protein
MHKPHYTHLRPFYLLFTSYYSPTFWHKPVTVDNGDEEGFDKKG